MDGCNVAQLFGGLTFFRKRHHVPSGLPEQVLLPAHVGVGEYSPGNGRRIQETVAKSVKEIVVLTMHSAFIAVLKKLKSIFHARTKDYLAAVGNRARPIVLVSVPNQISCSPAL